MRPIEHISCSGARFARAAVRYKRTGRRQEMVLMPENIYGDDASQSKSFPIGATLLRDGVNFSVYSRSATGMELLPFDHVDDARPVRTIRFDPQRNRTFSYWHIFVPGVRAGQIYGFRAHGHEPPWGWASTPTKCCSLLRAWCGGAGALQPSSGLSAGRQHPTRHEKRRRRHPPLRLGR